MNKKSSFSKNIEIGNIVAEDIIRHIGVNFSKSGLIPQNCIAKTIQFIENEISSFETAVNPDAARAQILSLLVNKSITSRLRWMAEHMTLAANNGCDIALEELRG